MNEKYKVTSISDIHENDSKSIIEVTNENGNSITREIDTKNIYYTLLTENKMELIGLKKEEINKEINAALERKEILKYAAPIYPIIIVPVAGFLILVKVYRPDALVGNSWQAIVAATSAGLACVGAVAIVEHIYNKKEIKILKEQLRALNKYANEPINITEGYSMLEHDFSIDNKNIEEEIELLLKKTEENNTKKLKRTKD